MLSQTNVHGYTHSRMYTTRLQSNQESQFCLCIKTELCDKVTLKTWLDDRTTIHDRKRIYVIDCFMEVGSCAYSDP